jgi:hypothetical protein
LDPQNEISKNRSFEKKQHVVFTTKKTTNKTAVRLTKAQNTYSGKNIPFYQKFCLNMAAALLLIQR